MFKKTLIMAGVAGLIFGLTSCQTDNDLGDPVSLPDDARHGVYGWVTYDDNSGPAVGVKVATYCIDDRFHDPPWFKVGDTATTDVNGYYSIYTNDFGYHVNHLFLIEYGIWDGGGWTIGYTDDFVYTHADYRFDFEVPAP